MGMGLIIAAAATMPGPAMTGAAPACLRAMASISTGAVPSLRDFAPSACDGKAARAFRFDAAARTIRSVRPIRTGDIVPSWPDAQAEAIRPGDRLFLKVAMGSVLIEREVEALQPAVPGERLFVRDGDMNILSVRYESVSK